MRFDVTHFTFTLLVGWVERHYNSTQPTDHSPTILGNSSISCGRNWIPAFAGMTFLFLPVVPAKAGIQKIYD